MHIRAAIALAVTLACGRTNFDVISDSGGASDVGADGTIATPRCTIPARPDVANPRVTLGCDQIVATQEILNGGVVRFDCTTGVLLGAPIIVNKDTVIDGRGVILDGQNITQVVRVTNNARLTLLDVTVTRGFASNDHGGGIRLDSGTLVAFDSTFSDNNGPAPSGTVFAGGAIAAVPNQATIEIYGGRFTNNTAPNGGAIKAYAGLVVMNATLDNNVATGAGGSSSTGGEGGAVHVVGPGDTTFCGVTLNENVGNNIGGGMTVISTSNTNTLALTDVVFDSNRGAGGGGVYTQGLAMVRLRRVSATNNLGTGGAGAGLWMQGPGIVDGETVSVVANRNDNGVGAGIFFGTVTGSLAFSTIADNLGNCPSCAAGAIGSGANVALRATVILDNASLTTPEACSETATNGGAVFQWPGDPPLCATGATLTDPLLEPRALATGPAGTLLVRSPAAGSAVTGAVATGCPTEDLLGNPRPMPCAAGAVERR